MQSETQPTAEGQAETGPFDDPVIQEAMKEGPVLVRVKLTEQERMHTTEFWLGQALTELVKAEKKICSAKGNLEEAFALLKGREK